MDNFTAAPKSHDYKIHCSVHSFLFTSFPFAQEREALEARFVSKKVTAWKGGGGKWGWVEDFTQTTVVCQPKPRVGVLFHRNAVN